jgi:hypothetical protein
MYLTRMSRYHIMYNYVILEGIILLEDEHKNQSFP